MTRVSIPATIVLVLGLGCADPDAGSARTDSATDATSNTTDSAPPTTTDGTSDAAGAETTTPVACRADGDGATTLVFVNGCDAPLTVRGSDLDDFVLAAGASACRDIGTADEELPSKRYWGFRGADPGGGHHTLAELTFNTDFHDFDWYNISHVDAHNLTMRLTPLDRPDCDTLVCTDPGLLADCPAEGRLEDDAGALVACVSPDRDHPDSPVARHFESCDDAYAWSGDDQQGADPSPVRACAGEDWEITFCP